MTRQTLTTAAAVGLLLLLIVGACVDWQHEREAEANPTVTPTRLPITILPAPSLTPTLGLPLPDLAAWEGTVTPERITRVPTRSPEPAVWDMRPPSPTMTPIPPLILIDPTVRPATPTAAVQRG